ncbi:MAG: hypothetical protein M1829_006809 [Trizodia sp. TS-e1964]|nr:MAG: hypothetical protein M1829_006809 [Trizodia sp. TS-e1964]
MKLDEAAFAPSLQFEALAAHIRPAKPQYAFQFPLFAASALLLVSTARACLVYTGAGSSTYLTANLVNNGQQVCSFNGPIGADGLFRFTCIAANYAAIADKTGIVSYADPSGNFRFQAQQPSPGQWKACNYGCGANQCFSTTIHVGDSLIDYGDLNPGDVAKRLPSICAGGTCDSTPFVLTSQYTTGGAVETLDLTVTVNGVFDVKRPSVLNGLIAAIQATAGTGFQTQVQNWRTGAMGNHFDTTDHGSLSLNKQSSFFGAVISDDISGTQTPWFLTLSVTSAVETKAGGACGFILTGITGIAAAINPAAGAALGVLSGACGLISGA